MDEIEAKKNVHLEMRNSKQRELQSEEQRKERLRIKLGKDRKRRRTKKTTVVRNKRPRGTARGHSQEIEARG